jgi:hypothetical protein
MPTLSPDSYTLKAELHCHSQIFKKISYAPVIYDSVQTVDEVLNACLKKNIGILALTDHDSLAGYRKAWEIIQTRHLPILLIPACEITSDQGHILAYGITKELPKYLSPAEVVKQIHAQGGLAVAAHPFFSFGVKNQVYNSQFDLLEGFNSLIPQKANQGVVAASEKIGIPYLTGSDAHIPKNIGRSINLFPSDTASVDLFLEHLRKGEFIPRPVSSPLISSLVEAALSSFRYSLFHK